MADETDRPKRDVRWLATTVTLPGGYEGATLTYFPGYVDVAVYPALAPFCVQLPPA